MQRFSVNTRHRTEFVPITRQVQAAAQALGVAGGCITVFVPHTTAGVTINENADPDVRRDLLQSLRRLVPERGDYLHAEGNSDAHLKASFFGSSVTVLAVDGRLKLGTWQSVFYCEFDGPRTRKLWVQVMKGGT